MIMKKVHTNRVWLIDDDSVNNMIHEIFFKDFFPNIVVRSFEEADVAYEELKGLIASRETKLIPDFIFLDINMPVMNGWDFLDEFHDNMFFMTQEIKMVMLTSSIDTVDYNRALQFPSVVGYLIKPLDLEKVEGIIS